MARFFVERDSVRLAVEEVGEGRPVVFQHGLGGNAGQVAEVFPREPAVRRITLECRGQGLSEPGPPAQLRIGTFSADVAFLAEHLRLGRAIFGGISLGAAIALRLAVNRPDLVGGLILARPAWLFDLAPENMRPYAQVGELLERHDPKTARVRFRKSATARRLAREAPDNLASLNGFFDHPQPKMLGALLRAIAADGPCVSAALVRSMIRVPTLVIGHGEDLAHPWEYAEALAATIPDARLVRITSKAVDRGRYVAEFKAAVAAFLAA
jgi:pimeloyl-ACP methyl ester carboxylesterase